MNITIDFLLVKSNDPFYVLFLFNLSAEYHGQMPSLKYMELHSFGISFYSSASIPSISFLTFLLYMHCLSAAIALFFPQTLSYIISFSSIALNTTFLLMTSKWVFILNFPFDLPNIQHLLGCLIGISNFICQTELLIPNSLFLLSLLYQSQ